MNRLYRAERESRIYYGWIVVGIVFLTLLVSAAINSLPSVLMLSLEDEFGWDRGAVSAAASIRIHKARQMKASIAA